MSSDQRAANGSDAANLGKSEELFCGRGGLARHRLEGTPTISGNLFCDQPRKCRLTSLAAMRDRG